MSRTKTKDIRKQLKHGRSTSSKSIFVLSDVHIGSTEAACSDSAFMSNQGGYFKPRKRNKMIYDFIISSKDKLKNGKPYMIICNGESIDGPDNKGRGKQTWSNNPIDQTNEVCKIFKQLPVQNGNRFFVKGSNYHISVNNNMNIEEIVAEKMNAKIISLYGEEQDYQPMTIPVFSGDDYYQNYIEYPRTSRIFHFSIFNKYLHFAHPIASSMNFMYRATPLAREMMILKLEAGRAFPIEETPHIVIRSHTHHYTEVGYCHSAGRITAGLQLPNDFQLNSHIAGSFFDIGVLEIIIEPNGEFNFTKIFAPDEITQCKVYKY
ncbi:MAG: hypothetical protein R3321_02925 [Nitrososphaeraceae archaeon]|nr:hypothetical protein [Nitrososphaeraceae archaeon]